MTQVSKFGDKCSTSGFIMIHDCTKLPKTSETYSFGVNAVGPLHGGASAVVIVMSENSFSQSHVSLCNV